MQNQNNERFIDAVHSFEDTFPFVKLSAVQAYMANAGFWLDSSNNAHEDDVKTYIEDDLKRDASVGAMVGLALKSLNEILKDTLVLIPKVEVKSDLNIFISDISSLVIALESVPLMGINEKLQSNYFFGLELEAGRVGTTLIDWLTGDEINAQIGRAR